jgi:hypothetical protein
MSDDKTLVVVDGDLLAFKCAAVTEKRSVIATHKDTLDKVEFDTATKFKEWAGVEADSYELEAVRTPEPIANTLRSIKTKLNSIIKACKADNYHIVVSGDNNFRKQIPLPSQYKNTRNDAGKPINLAEAKEYLIKHHDAEVAVGEADEVLVAYAYQGYKEGSKVIQASIDKDAYHGPGWLYNWDAMDEPELIEGFGKLYINDSDTVKGCGRVFLIFQMLFGDPIDAYKPCELAKVKFGEKGAYKLLKDCTTDKEAVEALVKQYKKWYPEPVTYRAWDNSLHTKDWMEIWQMYADCAFMPRWDGDRLDVKKLLDKLGIAYGN